MNQNSKPGEFETYLQGKTDLSQAYADLPQVKLPDHLDAAILAEAHRAVSARPAAKPKRRWTIPLGMVASLFAVVMIGLQLPYMLKETALPRQQKEKMVAAIEKILAEPASPALGDRREIQLMAKPRSEITRVVPAPMTAEAAIKPNAPMLAAPQASPAAGADQLGATSAATPPPVAAPSQAPAKAARRLELRERADADNGVSLSKEKKASGYAEGSASDALEQRAPTAAEMAPPQSVPPSRSLMQPLKDETGEASLRPEDWLIRIRRLKQQGKLDEAKKELAAFKKRYPDYRVPEALELR